MQKPFMFGLGAIVVLVGAYGVFAAMANQSEERANAVIEQSTDNTADSSATPAEDGGYTVQTTDSTVNWKGSKTLIENYFDVGTIGLKDGTVTVKEGEISGEFTIDMTTITATTTASGGGQETLSNHLKSPDFFDVEKFPTAKFVVTSISANADAETSHQYTAVGNLTIKEKTNEITFPATIYMQDGALHVEATADVDRTKFDVRFGSDSFFDNLGNNVISDIFTVAFHVIAK